MPNIKVPMSVLFAVLLAVATLSFDPASVVQVERSSSKYPIDLGEVTVFWPRERNRIDVIAVAVGPSGDVFAIHRDNRGFSGDGPLIERPVIVRLDPDTAEVKAEIGGGHFINPHGLSVAADGTLWVTDIGLNSVIKLSQDGTLLASFGDTYPFWMEPALRLRNVLPRLPIPMSKSTFARPTDVVPLPSGGFAVTDGYRNARLAVFNAAGVMIWERNSRGSGVGSFHLPHGLAADSEGRLFVADRRNARVQVFSPEGEVLAHLDDPELGRPFGLDIDDDNCLFVVDGGDLPDVSAPPSEQEPRRGLSNSSFGSSDFGPAKRVATSLGFVLPHDVAIGPDGTVFIADPEAGKLFSVRFEDECGPE